MSEPDRSASNDSTVARIAGNLLSGVPQWWLPGVHPHDRLSTVKAAVETARFIVAETQRTEPKEHVLSGVECWCNPRIDRRPGYDTVVVHNSEGGRELVEGGRS